MITVRVFLKCAASANCPGGEFNTFVALPETGFRRGTHIKVAEHRARVIGFQGPYEVIEIRRLDAPQMSLDEMRERLVALSRVAPQRCISAIDQHEHRIAEPSAPPGPSIRASRRRRTT